LDVISDLLLKTNLGEFVNTYDWVWPVCEILHFFGMALLIGTVGLADLRILGVAKGLRIATIERFIPLGVVGFCINVATGFIFVAGNPVGGPIEYLENLAFLIKMALILLAGINLLIFYAFGISRSMAALAPDADAPLKAKLVAAFSLFAWFGVIFFGRLIMYNDTLLYALGL
jgi:hypothetical protein